MPLTGTYTRNVDDKQRLAIPKRLIEQFGEGELASLYVAPGTETSLALYSPQGFHALGRKLAENTSNRADVRNYLRLFYSRADEVPIDKQGRVRIPERLIEFAKIQHDVVVLGVHDHAELWDKSLWERFEAEHSSRFDEMATEAFE